MLKISLLLISLKNNKYNRMKYVFHNVPPIFCTFAWQRSGTKFLSSCLRKGIDIIPLGEIFNPDGNGFINYYNWANNEQKTNKVDIITEVNLDDFFAQILSQFGPVHFDVMLNQLIGVSPKWSDVITPYFIEYTKSRGSWVVLLTRSTASSFLSSEILEISGQPHEVITSKSKKIKEFSVDLNKYVLYHKKIESFYELIRINFSDYPRFIEIPFYDLIGNNGLLPINLTNFFSMAIKNYYGEDFETNIQIKGSALGKSSFNPQDYILNYSEIEEMENKLRPYGASKRVK